jgi:hypothetical protein
MLNRIEINHQKTFFFFENFMSHFSINFAPFCHFLRAQGNLQYWKALLEEISYLEEQVDRIHPRMSSLIV